MARGGHHGAGLNDEAAVDRMLWINKTTEDLKALIEADPEAAEAFCGVIDADEIMEFLSDDEDYVDEDLTRRVKKIRNAVMDFIQSIS